MELSGHAGRITGVVYGADGKTLVSCSLDGSIRVWDLPGRGEKGKLTGLGPLLGLALSPDGRRLAVAGESGLVRLRNLGSIPPR